MFTLGPETVTADPIVLNPQAENVSAQPIVGILVFNASNETFKISFQGTSDWLHGYSVASLAASGNNVPNITLVPQDSTGSGSVYATVYQQGDSMPSNVPTTINATNISLAAGASVDVNGGTVGVVNPTSGDTTKIFTAIAKTTTTYDLPDATIGTSSGTYTWTNVFTAPDAIDTIYNFSGSITMTCTSSSNPSLLQGLQFSLIAGTDTIITASNINGTSDSGPGNYVWVAASSGGSSFAKGTVFDLAMTYPSTGTYTFSTSSPSTVSIIYGPN